MAGSDSKWLWQTQMGAEDSSPTQPSIEFSSRPQPLDEFDPFRRGQMKIVSIEPNYTFMCHIMKMSEI